MLKSKLRRIMAIGLTILSCITVNPICANAEWKKDSNGWWYTEGSSYAKGWKNINNSWYYFNSDGYMEYDKVIDNCVLGFDGAWKQNATLLNEKGSKLLKGYWANARASAPNQQGDISQYTFDNYKIIEDGESYCIVDAECVIDGVTYSQRERLEFYKANNIPNEPICMDRYTYREDTGEYNFNYSSYVKYKDEYELAKWICGMLPYDINKYEELYEKYADSFFERGHKDVAIEFLNMACEKVEKQNYDSSNLRNKISELQNK